MEDQQSSPVVAEINEEVQNLSANDISVLSSTAEFDNEVTDDPKQEIVCNLTTDDANENETEDVVSNLNDSDEVIHEDFDGTHISSSTQTKISSSNFVTICGDPNNLKNNFFELPLDSNGDLPKTTLQAQFPLASSVKYRNPETGAIRILQEEHEAIKPPPEGWGKTRFVVNIAKRPNTSDVKQTKFARFSSPTNSQRSPLIRNGPLGTASGFLPPLLPPAQMNPYPAANFMPHRMGMEFQSFSSPSNFQNPPNNYPLFCEVCNIKLNDVKQAAFHYEGRRHNDMLLQRSQRQNFPCLPPQSLFNSSQPGSRRGGVPNRGFPRTRGGGPPKISNGRGAPFARGRIGANRSRGRGAAKEISPRKSGSSSSNPSVNKTQHFDKDEFEGIQRF